MPQLSLPGINKHQPRCSTKRPQPPLLTPSKERIPHRSLHQAGHHSHGLTFTVGPRDLLFSSSQHISTTTKDSAVTMPGSHSPLNHAKSFNWRFPTQPLPRRARLTPHPLPHLLTRHPLPHFHCASTSPHLPKTQLLAFQGACAHEQGPCMAQGP